MKKLALFLITFSICSIFCSCHVLDNKKINYDGPSTINIALRESLNLNASSKEALTYYSDNELYVTVSPDGVINGKNVGSANITISNSENSITVNVVVSLFEEPTLDFYVSKDEIKRIYGEPRYIHDNNVFVYGGGNNEWYSWAVWEMYFFFNEYDAYYESDLYIRNDLDLLLSKYLNDNYFYYRTIAEAESNTDSIYLYLDKPNAKEASVIVGKQYNAGANKDIRLMYAPFSIQ